MSIERDLGELSATVKSLKEIVDKNETQFNTAIRELTIAVTELSGVVNKFKGGWHVVALMLTAAGAAGALFMKVLTVAFHELMKG